MKSELNMILFDLGVMSSVRPNRSGSGSGSAELGGSVRFGRTTEPRVFTGRTRTEPKTVLKPSFCPFFHANPETQKRCLEKMTKK